MHTIKVKDKLFRPFISEETLQELVSGIAGQINEDYQDKSPIFIGVLNGSFMFFADLLRSINLQCKTSFIKLASYEGMVSGGEVNELIGINEDLKGEDVVLVEDIVDTGNTLDKIYQIFKSKEVKSIKIAALLHKPLASKKSYNLDYIGMEIPDSFVVGYGLDYDGFGRNLSSIYVLN